MYRRLLGAGLAAALVLNGCASSGGRFSANSPEPLEPFGVKADSPAVIQMVNAPGSPVSKGDTVVSLNGSPVTTLTFFTHFTPTGEMQVQNPQGKVRTVSDSSLLLPSGKGLKASPIPLGGTLLFPKKVPAYNRQQESAFALLGSESALVTASLWHTKPRIIEIYVELRAGKDCSKCSLKNLGVLDWSHKAWLSPVSYSQVAWVLYPADAPAGALMNVPPPTPIGSTSTSTMTGTLNGTSYGNSYYGNYSGYQTTTTTPYYDYAATDMALAYNLGTIIRQNRIAEDNKNRQAFVANRISNLKTGSLLPGEVMSGYVDVVVPNGFNGPYIVGIKGDGTLAAVRFDIPEN